MAGSLGLPPRGLTVHRVLQRHTVALVLLVATMSLLLFYYFARADIIGVAGAGRSWTPMTLRPHSPVVHFLLSALLLAGLPVLGAQLVTRRSLRELGLGLGRWREGLVWLAVGLPLAVVAGRMAATQDMMRAVYPLAGAIQREHFAWYAALQLLYFGAWEVLFRGVLLFGLEDRLGRSGANAVQTVCSVLAHFGRAVNETTAALPAGLLFGWIGLRVRSVWYVALIHWTVGISMDWHILASGP